MGKVGKGSWGLGLGFGYTDISIKDNLTVRSDVLRLTDSFDVTPLIPLAGIGPNVNAFSRIPLAPTVVPANGLPSRTAVVPSGAIITAARKFDAGLWGFKLGPFIDYPVSRKLSLGLGGGLAVAYLTTKYSFSESTTIPSMGTIPLLRPPINNTQAFSGGGHGEAWRAGIYVDGRVSYSLSQHVDIFASAEFQYLGEVNQRLGGHGVSLDLGQSVFTSLGLCYSF